MYIIFKHVGSIRPLNLKLYTDEKPYYVEKYFFTGYVHYSVFIFGMFGRNCSGSVSRRHTGARMVQGFTVNNVVVNGKKAE